MKVAVVGGTGDFGLALAQQLVAAGVDVVIGSRDAARAQEKANEIGATGAANEDAVRGVDLVVLATKADAALATAESLAGAIGTTPVLSVASELSFTKRGVYPDATTSARSPSGSPSCSTRRSRRGSTRSPRRRSPPAAAECDALVCGDDLAAKELALDLAAKVVTGRALDAGPLASARALEGMTAVIVNLNRRYKGHAGFSVTGLP